METALDIVEAIVDPISLDPRAEETLPVWLAQQIVPNDFTWVDEHLMKKLLASFAMACACLGTTSKSAQAFEPYGLYGYGLALGPSYVFRNRLPTPPYFSIYSPVYYGQQYERPYGISPYAALPEVHVPETYVAQPRATASFILNPYCDVQSVVPQATSVDVEAPFAATGKPVWIENPYVSADSQIAVR